MFLLHWVSRMKGSLMVLLSCASKLDSSHLVLGTEVRGLLSCVSSIIIERVMERD